ncbi:MAG: hypothetical protein N3G80_00980 [Candidatus Micrarchaeota archaeon]|nr:hypothetical protein [Candidatus Micrarchaeota archaeon]
MSNFVLVATAMLASLAFVLQLSNNVIGLQTGFGMTIDLVAFPTLLAFFLFGFVPALEVLLLSTIFIAIFASSGPIGAAMKFGATLPTLLVFFTYHFFRSRGTPYPSLAVVLVSLLFGILVFGIGAFSYSYVSKEGRLVVGLLPILAMSLAAYLLYKLFQKAGRYESLRIFQQKETVAILALLVVLVRGVSMVVANFYFAGPLYFKMTPEEFIAFMSSADLLFFGSGATWYIAIFAFNAIQAIIELGLAWSVAFKLGFVKKYAVA